MPIAPFLVGAALGGGLLWLGLHQRRKLMDSLSWPRASGTVTQSAITQSESGDAEEGYSTSYSAAIQYHYLVDGQAYRGTRIAHVGRSYARPAQAQAELAHYPLNSTVVVYFNPYKPSEAVLERKAPGSNFLVWAGAIILAIVVIALLKGLS